MKSLLLFIVGGLLFGAAALGAGYYKWDTESLVQGSAAFGLTYLPAVATLAWGIYSYRSTPDMQLLASLGSSGLRMAIGLGGGYFLTTSEPDTFDMVFWYWLVLFYLVLLGFEITLLVRQPANLNESPRT